jgi:hypothetical protein
MWCKLLCLAGSDLRDQNLVLPAVPESAAQDWEAHARTGVGSVREAHRHTATGLVRDIMTWIT